MNEQERRELGADVRSARLRRGLTKEGIARAVGISSITYKKIEDGESVREDNLARTLGYLDLPIPGAAKGAPSRRPLRQAVLDAAYLTDDERQRLLALIDAREAPRGGEEIGAPIDESRDAG